MQWWTIDAGHQGSYWTWPSHELGQRSWGGNNVKCKMHQIVIVIDKWNLQITRVNEIIASRPVGQAMPAIGCYQFHPCSSSPCLAVKTTHDNWYNDIRQLFNCEKRFFIETKLQKSNAKWLDFTRDDKISKFVLKDETMVTGLIQSFPRNVWKCST